MLGGSLRLLWVWKGEGVRSSREGCGHQGRDIEEHASPSLYVSSVLYVLVPNHLPSDGEGHGGALGKLGQGQE